MPNKQADKIQAYAYMWNHLNRLQASNFLHEKNV